MSSGRYIMRGNVFQGWAFAGRALAAGGVEPVLIRTRIGVLVGGSKEYGVLRGASQRYGTLVGAKKTIGVITGTDP